MIDTIFFDLDGTLLLMDQDEFLKHYFDKLKKKFGDESILKVVKVGVVAMIENDGSKTNEKAFWDVFNKLVPNNNLENKFIDFYTNEFQELKSITNMHNQGKEAIKLLKSKGYDIALCTNPFFPKIATYSRIMWAGIDPEDFIWITTYENSHYCKPNLKYYEEVLQITNKKPENVLMVGNDVLEDLCVKKLGMKTFLVEDNLINKNNLEIISDYNGSFKAFYEFVKSLPERINYGKVSTN
ncbi:MAG TPA: HAD family hydrolase [Acholeplasmataceae bacterium]|nr:HAD family hydrolase [Acholeplasmataceae bacterium]